MSRGPGKWAVLAVLFLGLLLADQYLSLIHI